MAKPKKQRAKGKERKRGSRFRRTLLWALAVLGVAGGLIVGRLWLEPSRSGGSVGRRETRPTLSPSLFVGKAAWAHEVAQEIPEILDQLSCYCECDKHSGHKSLLSCYTDGHAAT